MQHIVTDIIHKDGKPQNVIAKEGVYSHITV